VKRSTFSFLWIFAGTISTFAVICGIAVAGDDGHRFGLWCQKSFEDGWRDSRSYANNNCNGFASQMDNTTTKHFYFNLHGARSHLIENGYGENLDTDNVDLLVISTHGGAWSATESTLCMWDKNTRVFYHEMRLGNDGRQLSILSTYACQTMKWDGNFGNRTRNAWRGGLKYMTGSHDTVVSSYWTDDCLEDYASYLQDGDKIKYAWKDGMYDTYIAQDVIAAASGTNCDNSAYRKNNMRWNNFDNNTNFPRIRDNSIGCYSSSRWTDL
jgi:hypothetical protein